MRTFISFVLCISCVGIHVFGDIQEQIAEVSQICCAQGLRYSKEHKDQGPEGCSSSLPPEDAPKDFGSICIYAMDKCCKEAYKEKNECDAGLVFAKTKQCGDPTTDIGKNCCEECSLGRLTGESQGSEACSREGSEEESTSIALRKGAFTSCCLEAANERDDSKQEEETKPTYRKPETRSGEDVASICEEFAPDELCAHHCIPVPGSYRCECNPGYMLMADKKSCKKVENNRCKPKNPCQHKCNDNGREVKCSCRRGYELQPDKKSCKDINECDLELHICTEGTVCQNTEGSYKCIPVKQRTHTTRVAPACPAGFKKNVANNVCDDIDECKQPVPPCPKYLCVNTIGGFTCGGVPGKPTLEPSSRFAASTTPTPPEEDLCPPGFKTGYGGQCEDIDECTYRLDDCNRLSQFCLNRHGSFTCQDQVSKHCPPGFKVNTRTGICEDIDECEDNDDLCPDDQICYNVPGAYLCNPRTEPHQRNPDCPEGTRLRAGSSVCDDIDECREGLHLCDQFQNCLNTYGGHECRCKLGFELDPLTGACVDVNECLTDQNKCIAASQRCDNTVGSYTCVRFTSCGTGYVLQASSGQCEDVDECVRNMHNCYDAGPEFYCVNQPGTFSCVRNYTRTKSTTLPPDEYYYDYDEEVVDNQTSTQPQPNTRKADENIDNQSSGQSPTNQPQSPPRQPQTPHNIHNNARPMPPATTFPPRPEVQPTSPAKQQPESETPEENSTTNDQNPYEQPSEYPKNPESNYPYTPSENPPKTQEPKNNNQEPAYPYEPPESPLSNPEQSQPGPEENNVIITPRPRAETTPKDNLVPVTRDDNGTITIDTNTLPMNTWTNLRPDFEDQKFNCLQGYTRNSYGECVDIDECSSGTHVCSSLTEVCRNTAGGYVCDCAPGFRKDPLSGWCATVAVTTPKTPSTFPSTTSTTTSTTPSSAPVSPSQIPYYGSRRPYYYDTSQTYRTIKPFRRGQACDVGYRFNTQTQICEDVNECQTGLAGCAEIEICVNTDGGYRCECPPHWKLDSTEHRCVPEKATGSFPAGYGNVDNENWSRNTKVITVGTQYGPQGSRYVTPSVKRLPSNGAILTSCPWGYKLGDDERCVDVDECAIGTARCGPQQQCTNYPGGYVCNCPSGHRLIGDNSCEDVDECAGDKACSQHSDCLNTVGGYRCQCHAGFRSAPINDKVCVDVDECMESRSGALCQHTCINVWGGYRCACNRGFRLSSDNRTCEDLDECEQFKDKHLCVGRCLNVPGSYKCSCPPGYKLGVDQRSCIDIDECETGEAPCSSGTKGTYCQNTRGGYKCHPITCQTGYQLEKKSRCTREVPCKFTDWDCFRQPSTYSFNFITFVSKLYIPTTHVNLFTMRGPKWPNSIFKFALKLVNVNTPPVVSEPADINCFQLTPTANQAVVSLVKSLEGPQSIELELSMELYTGAGEDFGGVAVAKIFIYVSEYEF